MELHETLPLMNSKDYKERFLGEYYQLDIRIKKLKDFLDKWDELDFEPNCPKELLEIQLEAMQDYHRILCKRAKIEHVEL